MKRETAEEILNEAHRLMTERGYSAFSYADIAAALGITKASIHFHFATKANLAARVLQRHREGLKAATDGMDRDLASPLARLRSYVGFWEGCIRQQTMPFCVAALLAAELPSLPEEVQVEVRRHFTGLADWLERTLREGADAGELYLRTSPEIEAQALMAVVHGAMLGARATGADFVFQASTKAALAQLSTAVLH